MDVSVADAVQALNAAVSGLLPPPTSAALAPDILINPLETHASGIGGYVGLHPAPLGEIHARRLKAQVVVRVKANTIADLSLAESVVTNALVAASPTLLRSQGIFRVSRDTAFGQVYLGADDGVAVVAGKDIRFDVDYEYRRLPDAPAGVIDDLPLDLLLQETGNAPRLLYGADFHTDPLAAFAVIDDAQIAGGPGDWSYDPASRQVEQTTGARGGNNNGASANKRGTSLVLRPSVAPLLPSDWVLHAEIGARRGGIGLVFNFVDSDNYHFFIMNRPAAYRFIGKRVSGAFSFVDVGARDNTTGYAAGDYRIRLIQQHGEFHLAIDNTPVLSGRDDSAPPAGRVGFFCRSCPTARFRSLRWIGL
jgi:hypothetical protein